MKSRIGLKKYFIICLSGIFLEIFYLFLIPSLNSLGVITNYEDVSFIILRFTLGLPFEIAQYLLLSFDFNSYQNFTGFGFILATLLYVAVAIIFYKVYIKCKRGEK